jgi:hypothetical protein
VSVELAGAAWGVAAMPFARRDGGFASLLMAFVAVPGGFVGSLFSKAG